MKFKNGTKDVTLEDCIRIHEAIGLNFIVTDGRDIDFEVEKRPLPQGPKIIY